MDANANKAAIFWARLDAHSKCRVAITPPGPMLSLWWIRKHPSQVRAVWCWGTGLALIMRNNEKHLSAVDPPDFASPVHRHNAQVPAYALEGSVVMQVQEGKQATLGRGESFSKSPTIFTSSAATRVAQSPQS